MKYIDLISRLECNNQMSDLAETSSFTPLNALSAVVLDTETTGLDIKNSRLIQIGAVRLVRGRIELDQTFESLVNPGEPIPSNSTKIHGLVDADVVDAPAFEQIAQKLNDWIGHSILIGYSIGFDLAIFERESKLRSIPWKAPRSIDVMHLVKIISPNLPDYSLDTIASWLDIDTSKRHQALGDAIITAEIYCALTPMLLNNGIRSLAELEAACRIANNGAITESHAGWYDFLYSNSQADISQQAFAKIDSYPYQHRVRDVMTSPAVVVGPDDSITLVLSRMMKQGISSVFVGTDTVSRPDGIITERDVLRALVKNAAATLTGPARQFAQTPLITVLSDAFIYRAMGRMSRNNIRHLGVIDKQGSLVGALSSRDLLKQRTGDVIDLGDRIDQATSGADLGVAWANLGLVVRALDREAVVVNDIAAVISRELCALTRRACHIAEQEMATSGMGEPPSTYTMLVLGSGGRGESLLALDQDNAIIYAADSSNGNEDEWFEKLGKRVADLLNIAGVPYCNGDVMASNKLWRLSVSGWKHQINSWITRTSPKDLLNTDIFFDAVAVHGDFQLMQDVMGDAQEAAANSRTFLHMMAINASNTNSPLGLFGRYKLKEGRVDAKLGGLLPIISSARVEAIRHRIHERATPERLREIQRITGSPNSLFENLIEAHRIILSAILKQQLYDFEHGIPLSNRVAPNAMNSVANRNLRWALEQVQSVSDLLGMQPS